MAGRPHIIRLNRRGLVDSIIVSGSRDATVRQRRGLCLPEVACHLGPILLLPKTPMAGGHVARACARDAYCRDIHLRWVFPLVSEHG